MVVRFGFGEAPVAARGFRISGVQILGVIRLWIEAEVLNPVAVALGDAHLGSTLDAVMGQIRDHIRAQVANPAPDLRVRDGGPA